MYRGILVAGPGRGRLPATGGENRNVADAVVVLVTCQSF